MSRNADAVQAVSTSWPNGCTQVPAGPREVDRLESALRAAETKIVNLERALTSNRRIGMAHGILMARLGKTEEQAFELLRTASQLQNRKLFEIAEDVLLTGAVPDAAADALHPHAAAPSTASRGRLSRGDAG